MNPDNAEMIWSIFLTTAYVAGSTDLIRKASESILDRLTARLEEESPLHDSFSVEFVTGLMLALDWSDDQVAEATANLQEHDSWGDGHRGMYIDGLGRAPAVNRNRASIADPRLYDMINEWAVEQIPRLAS